MSEMVERVARAIHECSVGKRTPWDQCDRQWQDGLRRDASAAIEAMREPTDGMVEKAQESYEGGLEWGLSDDEMRAAYSAMIDEALK